MPYRIFLLTALSSGNTDPQGNYKNNSARPRALSKQLSHSLDVQLWSDTALVYPFPFIWFAIDFSFTCVNMLGKGKSSGCINEASNLLANQNLTNTIEHMATKEYQQTRDESDIIPTHRRPVQEAPRNEGLAVYDPAAEKKAAHRADAENVEHDDEDDELVMLRQRRLGLLKKAQEDQAVYRSKQHGEYREIAQDDFFNIVVREKGGSDRCCIHFYHADFETCKVLDHHLSQLAKEIIPIKFCKINAEKSPFLVERLRVTTLPCCLLFKDDVAVDRIVGFEGCVGEDGLLDHDLLKERITSAIGKEIPAF